ncbi:MAG: indole-3-glycerol phosphate synthase TrpC [Armatimonadota bacterium]
MAKYTGTYLDRILADTAAALAVRTDLPTAPPVAPPARGFACALAAPGISLIAEVKKASPSRGVIREDFHPASIAKAYEAAGAAAISVLTDEKYFQGKLAYLEEARQVTTIPLLRKDFIIHPAQIFEAVGRADAVLLIVAALTRAELADFLTVATECGLDTLVEVHDRAELDIALEVGAPVIGINNRDLRTFTIDVQTTFDLLPYIPDDRLVVSESGIHTGEQVAALAAAGVDALLVGESLMVSADIGAKVRELLGIAG